MSADPFVTVTVTSGPTPYVLGVTGERIEIGDAVEIDPKTGQIRKARTFCPTCGREKAASYLHGTGPDGDRCYVEESYSCNLTARLRLKREADEAKTKAAAANLRADEAERRLKTEAKIVGDAIRLAVRRREEAEDLRAALAEAKDEIETYRADHEIKAANLATLKKRLSETEAERDADRLDAQKWREHLAGRSVYFNGGW